jgi:hypothetical protein
MITVAGLKARSTFLRRRDSSSASFEPGDTTVLRKNLTTVSHAAQAARLYP